MNGRTTAVAVPEGPDGAASEEQVDLYLSVPDGPVRGGIMVIHEVWGWRTTYATSPTGSHLWGTSPQLRIY